MTTITKPHQVFDLGGMPLSITYLDMIMQTLNSGESVVIHNSKDNNILDLGLALMAHFDRMRGHDRR